MVKPNFDEIFGDTDFEFDPSLEVDRQLRDSRRAALEDALSRVDDVDDCWDIFRQAITQSILDSQVIRQILVVCRAEIARSVHATEYDRLVNIAANKLITRDREAVLTEAGRILLQDPKNESEVRQLAVQLLREQLKKEIGAEVREQLKSDPDFVEDVKRELKRQIMGI